MTWDESKYTVVVHAQVSDDMFGAYGVYARKGGCAGFIYYPLISAFPLPSRN